jgi:hypothetical protein
MASRFLRHLGGCPDPAPAKRRKTGTRAGEYNEPQPADGGGLAAATHEMKKTESCASPVIDRY